MLGGGRGPDAKKYTYIINHNHLSLNGDEYSYDKAQERWVGAELNLTNTKYGLSSRDYIG